MDPLYFGAAGEYLVVQSESDASEYEVRLSESGEIVGIVFKHDGSWWAGEIVSGNRRPTLLAAAQVVARRAQ